MKNVILFATVIILGLVFYASCPVNSGCANEININQHTPEKIEKVNLTVDGKNMDIFVYFHTDKNISIDPKYIKFQVIFSDLLVPINTSDPETIKDQNSVFVVEGEWDNNGSTSILYNRIKIQEIYPRGVIQEIFLSGDEAKANYYCREITKQLFNHFHPKK